MTAIDASAAPDRQTTSARPVEPMDAGPFTAADPPPLIYEYEQALEQGVVSFEQVVQAAFGRRPAPAGSDQEIHAHYYPKLLQCFADAHKCPTRPNHGGILHYFFADFIDAAVIMTADDELYVHFKSTGSDEVAFIDLLIRMTGVHVKARHVLQREDYRTIMETVFVVISYCMASLDRRRSSPHQPEVDKRADVLEFLQSECARVEQNLDNIIQRRAERTYFNGMLGAVLALGVAGVLLANLLDRSGNFDNYQYLLVAGLAGSIGATISVMWRITFGRFSPSNAIIAFQQGKKASVTLAILGAVRPFIGTVFGIIVYALDRADLLPLKAPDSGADLLYFYAAIAFFAGFSERWAQSTLKNAIPLSGRSTPQPDPLVLAERAAELGSTQPARWLAAAAYDRWLMTGGLPQKYGTQYRSVNGRWVLHEVDPTTTDEERARWDVPPLAEARRRADQMACDAHPRPIPGDGHQAGSDT